MVIIMKTLIFNGSPRKNGDCSSLINLLTQEISGDYKIVNTYHCNISPCIDCRYCWNRSGCSIKDEMQSVYDYIQECDNILIASPIYFSELTGKLLDVASRLQTYFCAEYFRKEKVSIKPKKGAVILVGGGDGNLNKPYETAEILLHHMNTYDIFPLVSSFNTNVEPAIHDQQALNGVKGIIQFFNEVKPIAE